VRAADIATLEHSVAQLAMEAAPQQRTLPQLRRAQD
jgi:hypothetical protein